MCDNGCDDIGVEYKMQHAWHTWRLLHAAGHVLTEKVHIDQVLQCFRALHWDLQQGAVTVELFVKVTVEVDFVRKSVYRIK